MKKNESATSFVLSDVVSNWDDWFSLCGKLIKDLQEYEKYMQVYFFDMQYAKKPEDQHAAQLAYQKRHDCRFYDAEKKVPGWLWKRYGLISLAGIVLGIILSVFLFTDMTQRLVFGGIFGAAFFAGILFCCSRIHVLRLEMLFRKMRSIEDRLSSAIRYIPPKYRNSQAVSTFYDLYCSYGFVSFDKAVSACDTYLLDNNLVGAYMAELFDVPYVNVAGDIQTSSADSRGVIAGNTDMQDPALPDDIRAHTFTGVEDADACLDGFVGLTTVKDQIRQMKNRMNFYGSDRSERVSGNHMVFLGPPGTGKTTVARIITKILFDFGYIRENKCVEIDGGYLKSPYAGQTTQRANAILQYAMGGVLFIDEAYILTEDTANKQGAEAVGVLLKAMEDHRADFVCIMAGYEDNMNRMLASNEGFASRVKYKIYFDNFTTEELGEIFRGLMRTGSAHRYRIERDAFELLKRHFDKERRIAGFGNARVVRTAWDSILDIHADRFMQGDIPEEKKYVILKEDVQAFVDVRSKQMVEDGRNFIASHNLDSSVISLQELKQKTKPGSSDPDKDLAALTGLSVVKDEIERMKVQFSFYNGNMENNGNHMVFFGPPGTGKTTVAGIMTGYLYKMGLIQENSYLDVNGDFLRGMYLGHTGKRTEAIVQYAQGMVLFIDEAYLLTTNDGTSDAFGQEAIGVLLDAMEKYRKNFVVIFAGYDKEMQHFLDVNSGLRSRISLSFHFESYTPHELAQMFRSVARNEGFSVESDVWIPLQQYFKTKTSEPNFGNGRFVRQFFDEVKKSHIMNFASGQCPSDGKFRIYLSDVEPFLKQTSEETEASDCVSDKKTEK